MGIVFLSGMVIGAILGIAVMCLMFYSKAPSSENQ